MTVDDRLERLTERHEALTQSVELNGHQIRENTRAHPRTYGNGPSTHKTSEAFTLNMRDFFTGMRMHKTRISNLEQA